MEACGSYRNQACGKQETWTSNLLNTEDQWVSSAIVMVLHHSQHQKAKRKFLKLSEGPHWWTSKAAWKPEAEDFSFKSSQAADTPWKFMSTLIFKSHILTTLLVIIILIIYHTYVKAEL